MVKKVFRDILVILGLIVLWASTSRDAMAYISEKRKADRWWGTYQQRHGDLVGMSFLDFVPKFRTVFDYSVARPQYTARKNTELFLQGDSYTWYVNDTAFAGLSGFYHFNRHNDFIYQLDTTKANIMVIEISERFARDYFQDTLMLYKVHHSAEKRNSASVSNAINDPAQSPGLDKNYTSSPNIRFDNFFNPCINQNLEFNLFNYQFIVPVFELKAALNYYLFTRASGNVVLSDKKDFLFIKETVSPSGIESGYEKISPDNLTLMINNINTIYDRYKADGFKEVYLSIIPNSVTIMQPEGYNNFIPLLQNDPRLKMKIIDIYTVFKNNPEILYYCPGDTHWNNKGKREWLAMVNEILAK